MITGAKHRKSKSFSNGLNGMNQTERNMEQQKTGLQKLREPFPEHQISLLPKPTKKDAPKGKCNVCGGWHGLPAVHLSYVGHAALTDRLLDCDENWSWEPVAFGADGLPLLDKDGGMWIRLTVCGVTRLGYGDAQGKTGPDAMKERIGDALRNAAMRFGAALDLWHKGELHKDEDDEKAAGLPDNEVADLLIAMREAEDIAALDRVSAPLKDMPLSDEQRATLSSAYSKRKRELKVAA
jgi:hypothetical protein